MLKTYTQLKKVKIIATPKETGEEEAAKHDCFLQEIDFYTHIKSVEQRKAKEYQRILKGCEPDSIFELMLKNIEDKKENCKMPVRKFFDNTFGNLLNDALFKLQKRQAREPENEELFTTQGMIKTVAFHIADNLPDAEVEVKDDASQSDD